MESEGRCVEKVWRTKKTTQPHTSCAGKRGEGGSCRDQPPRPAVSTNLPQRCQAGGVGRRSQWDHASRVQSSHADGQACCQPSTSQLGGGVTADFRTSHCTAADSADSVQATRSMDGIRLGGAVHIQMKQSPPAAAFNRSTGTMRRSGQLRHRSRQA